MNTCLFSRPEDFVCTTNRQCILAFTHQVIDCECERDEGTKHLYSGFWHWYNYCAEGSN